MRKQQIRPSKGEIIIYQSKQGPQLEVQFDRETVWLTQDQMVKLFGRDQSVISRHITNVFNEKELDQKSNMQNLHIANSDKPVTFYSLNVVISTGYRVKSQEGTRFRIWATRTLRDHILKGFTINQQRIEQLRAKQFAELQEALALVQKVKQKELSGDEAKGLLDVITTYANSWALLNAYDQGNIDFGRLTSHSRSILT